MDAELRWNLWHALAANGQATAEQLDGELARDNTAAGKSGHATALAARPDAAVKEAAWHEAVHGTSLSNQLLSATIAGFNTGPGGPAGGLRWTATSSAWRTCGPGAASKSPAGLSAGSTRQGRTSDGGTPDTHAVIVRTDEWLAGHPDAPRALRRIIIEQRSHLHRALRRRPARTPIGCSVTAVCEAPGHPSDTYGR